MTAKANRVTRLRALLTMRCYCHIHATLQNVSYTAPEVRCSTTFETKKPFCCLGLKNQTTFFILAAADQE